MNKVKQLKKKKKQNVSKYFYQIVDFRPKPGAQEKDRGTYQSVCGHKPNAIAIHCYGEVILSKKKKNFIKEFVFVVSC